MSPEELATCWVPLPIRQRHIIDGDVFAAGGDLWTVRSTRPGWMDAARLHSFHAADVDPDQVFQVLTPVPMAQAMQLSRDELGARLLERRTTSGDVEPGEAVA